jgi:DNA-binding transcriptional regulator YhcF (GntR family)
MKKPPVKIFLELDSGVAAWRQIAGRLRTLIVEGALAPGEALPPVRRLAIDLGVHFNTVAEAYRSLAAEGLLEIAHGHGARVAAREAPPRRAPPEVAADFRRRLRELVAGMRARGLSPRQAAGELRLMAAGLERL